MLRVSFFLLSLLLLMLAIPSFAQNRLPPASDTQNSPAESDPELLRKFQRDQQKKRYEQMKRDSQRLLELTTELKAYVDNSGENILSMDVVRKAEEIEKLAHRVKENMRGN